MSTLIIAEAGVNHNGDLSIAKRLIDVAANAGADFVKFQTFSADCLVTRQAPKAEYQVSTTSESESQYAMLQRLELSSEDHKLLVSHCQSRGIGFLSTGFDVESIDFLAELGLEIFKVPSGEITNLPYLRHIGRYGKAIILSTGMSTLEEIGSALDALEKSGTPRRKITVLHCNSAYPTPITDVNLRAMATIRETFRVNVGYSDHTLGIEVPIAAVALGATVIEKHITLDRLLPGPDHQASLEPNELEAMVKSIRSVELALGSGHKIPSASEIKNKAIARKSIVAACTIKAGEVLTEEKLAIKRPGTGLSPMQWEQIIGLRARRDFSADEQIEL